jgi:flagellar biosynthesis component FlhA
VNPVADISATITSIGTLIAATGAAIVAVGSFWIANRNSHKAEILAEKQANAVAAAEAAKVAAEQTRREAKEAAAKNEATLIQVGKDVYALDRRVDGKLTELLELTRKAAIAEGRLEGIAAERAEQAKRAEHAKPTEKPDTS